MCRQKAVTKDLRILKYFTAYGNGLDIDHCNEVLLLDNILFIWFTIVASTYVVKPDS